MPKLVKRRHNSATKPIVLRIVIFFPRSEIKTRPFFFGLVAEAILGTALDNPASMTLCKNGEVFASL
jgi:hypothetical protein